VSPRPRPRRRSHFSPEDRLDASIVVKVRRAAPADIRLGLIGDGPVMGKWDTSQVNPMRQAHGRAVQVDPTLTPGRPRLLSALEFQI
jgi:hypothetical protein